LQANRKTLEGSPHPDRDAQFRYLANRVAAYQPQGQPVEVQLHDFGQEEVTADNWAATISTETLRAADACCHNLDGLLTACGMISCYFTEPRSFSL